MFGSAPAPLSDAQPAQIKATAQKMTFKPGLFSVLVTSGSAAATDDFPLPSVHLVEAPNNPAEARVSILSSQSGGWLTKPGDALVVKVEGQVANMILTSYSGDRAGSNLGVQITRLDTAATGASQAAAALVPAAPVPVAPRTVPADIIMHVQRQGDVRFSSGSWAGGVGKQTWIEAFAIVPTDILPPDAIEYKALTVNGWETPWVEGGKVCGSRGQGAPLVGFAIRLRGPAAERFDCVYEGAFVSGHRTTAYRNGSPCRSDVIGDPLEGILLHIVEKDKRS